MRVAQLIENLDAGGAEALVVDIANALAERGHDSHLIVVHGGGSLHSRLSASVTCVDLERPRTGGSPPIRLAYRYGTCRRLAQVLVRQRIALVQTHLPQANFLGLYAARRHLARVHPTIHNNREFDYGDPSPWKQSARRRAYRLMLDWCEPAVAVSERVRLSLARELGLDVDAMNRRIVAIPNGVHVPPAIGIRERAATRDRWNVAPDAVMIVGAGRLVSQKNFESLVEALALLRDAAVPWICVIAGEGEQRTGLERLVRDRGLAGRVVLAGHLEDVPALLSGADVFCLPSRFEGLPLALLEALAAGLPVCATRIDGIADVVVDGSEAVLVAPDDPRELADGLRRLLSDPGLRQRLGEGGRELVCSRYRFERMMDSLEALYRVDGATVQPTFP